jgi:hypothetical protein
VGRLCPHRVLGTEGGRLLVPALRAATSLIPIRFHGDRRTKGGR